MTSDETALLWQEANRRVNSRNSSDPVHNMVFRAAVKAPSPGVIDVEVYQPAVETGRIRPEALGESDAAVYKLVIVPPETNLDGSLQKACFARIERRSVGLRAALRVFRVVSDCRCSVFGGASLVIVGICAALLVLAAFAAWRYDVAASDPKRWRDDLVFDRQVALVRRYLWRQGWTMQESLTWLNVFVRCSRGHTWLNLIVHDTATLRIGTVAQDFIQSVSEKPFACGLLTRAFVAPDLRFEMARYGMFIVRPSDLPRVEDHIVEANRQLAAWEERRREERAAVAARPVVEADV